MRQDWCEIQIEKVFEKLLNGKFINQGYSPQCKSTPSPSQDIWGVLKTTAIQRNKFLDFENKELPEDKAIKSDLEVNIDDILITCAGPRNRCGVVCRVTKTRPKLLLSGKMYRFRANSNICNTKFLTYFLQSQDAWSEIDKMKTGGNESGLNLTQGRFKQLNIKITSLPEQRAIVSKIEELFSDLDKGIADLEKAKAQLAVYRQAVFSELINKDEQILLSEVIDELSQGWSPRCKNIASIDDNEWAVIKTSAIQPLRFVENENKILPQNLDPREQHEIESGDILITRAGPRKRVGICCLVKSTRKKLINCDKVYRIRANKKKVHPEFLEYILNSPEISLKIEELKSGINDSGLNLTQRRFLSLKVPVPSLSEQNQLIKILDEKLTVCDQVEKNINDSLEKSKALRQSILKKAFEGRLLTEAEIEKCKQADDYEPAHILLEKIKAEKANN